MGCKVIDDREPGLVIRFGNVRRGDWCEVSGDFYKRIRRCETTQGKPMNACDVRGELFLIDIDRDVEPVDVELHIVGAAT